MDGRDLRAKYIEIMFERVREVQHPSIQHMDRLESMLETQDQLEEYASILFEKLQATRYPSAPILDRVERVVSMI